MNIQQKNYTIKRIEEIARSKRAEMQRAKLETFRPELFGTDEAFAALKAGRGYDVTKKDVKGMIHLHNVILPVGYEKAMNIYEVDKDFLNTTIRLELERLAKLITKTSDKVMLGDDADAAAALEEIASFDISAVV